MNNPQFEQLRKALRNGIETNDIAGGNLMIIKGGKEIFYHEDGYADIEKGIPIKRNSIFRLYSMSKPVTATAVMILLERGKIDLFEPVSRFLPGFKNQMVDENGKLVPVEREVNINDLLSMTSGLVYCGDDAAGKATEGLLKEVDGRLLGDNPMGTVEIMNKLGKFPLAFQPGTAWHYGISADVLGAVVEIVSGMRFGEFLHKEIFEPLGMNDTGFWVPSGKRDRLAKAYADNGNGGLALYTENYLEIINKMDRDPAFESGGAGLASTIDDSAKFTMMLMNNGALNGVRILRPKTVGYLTSCTLTEEQRKGLNIWHGLKGYSYGNLMRVMADCSKAGCLVSPGEYGWDGWLGAYFCNCPKDDLTFLFMMQKVDAGTTCLTRKLRNIVLSSYCN